MSGAVMMEPLAPALASLPWAVATTVVSLASRYRAVALAGGGTGVLGEQATERQQEGRARRGYR